jgi:hypothetical protein
MHFQFLMANDRPGEFDYVMMIVGPHSLLARVQFGQALGTALAVSGKGAAGASIGAAAASP